MVWNHKDYRRWLCYYAVVLIVLWYLEILILLQKSRFFLFLSDEKKASELKMNKHDHLENDSEVFENIEQMFKVN